MEQETVSIHARLATGDLFKMPNISASLCFNSRPSCDGRQPPRHSSAANRRFNSRPSCDGRLPSASRPSSVRPFQFTPVLRRAT